MIQDLLRGAFDRAETERRQMIERIALLEKCCSDRDMHIIQLCQKSGDQQKRIAELENMLARAQRQTGPQ